MPKEKRKRPAAHASSVKLAKRQFATDAPTEHVELGSMASETQISANDILQSMSADDIPVLKKKEKQQLKHEAFLQRLQTAQIPYSKSHNRRLNRKAKEQVAGGLSSIHQAIALIERDSLSQEASETKDSKSQPKSKPKAGQIGKGKSTPLSSTQRKHALEIEKLRHPLILTNPEFASNPFQTIRTHATNSLLKH